MPAEALDHFSEEALELFQVLYKAWRRSSTGTFRHKNTSEIIQIPGTELEEWYNPQKWHKDKKETFGIGNAFKKGKELA